MTKNIFLIGLTLSLFVFTAARKPRKSEVSKELPKIIRSNYSWIPSGSVTIGKKKKELNGFLISRTEVSNHNYNEFLDWLDQNNRTELLKIAQRDTLNWRSEAKYQEPYVIFYHQHPAYRSYPVVNISPKAAEAYCNWLTDHYNKMYPEFNFTVKLPSQQQWVRASRPDSDVSIYSWGGPYLRNNKGSSLCNYKSLGSENITYDSKSKTYKVIDNPIDGCCMGVAGLLNDNADITAPVLSYFPSDYGLYNMNGNVAEMTTDGVACGGSWASPGYDVRNESTIEITGSSTKIGFRPIIEYTKK